MSVSDPEITAFWDLVEVADVASVDLGGFGYFASPEELEECLSRIARKCPKEFAEVRRDLLLAIRRAADDLRHRQNGCCCSGNPRG